MKKKLSLILVAVLVAISMVACGGGGEERRDIAGGSKGGEEVGKKLIVSWWGNQTRNERTQAMLDLYAENNPGTAFDGQFAEWSDYWNKLATSSAGGNLPDVVQMDYKYLEQYVNNGLLVDLMPYVESGVLDVSNVDEGILNSGKVDGGLYAIPIGINAPALLYNKTLLDEHGITVKDNMTLDEFMALSREIYEKTGYKTNFAYNNGDNLIEYLMRASGSVLFEADKLGVKDAEEIEAFFDVYEIGMEEGWHLDPSVFAERSIGSIEQEPLVYGESPETMAWNAMYYSNQLTAMQNAAPEGVEIGISTWPSPDPVASNFLRPSQFFSVTRDSKDPEEAAKVLDFVTNSIEANDILLGERGVPVSTTVAAAIAPKLSELEQVVIEYINNVVTPNSSPINPPAADTASEVFDLIDKLEERLVYGEITSKEAAAELFEKGNEIMGR